MRPKHHFFFFISWLFPLCSQVWESQSCTIHSFIKILPEHSLYAWPLEWPSTTPCSLLILHVSKYQSLSHAWLFVTPWTAAHQSPLSMRFSRQRYWSRFPFPSPGDLPNPGIEPRSPALQTDSLPTELQGKLQYCIYNGVIPALGLAVNEYLNEWMTNEWMALLIYLPPPGSRSREEF